MPVCIKSHSKSAPAFFYAEKFKKKKKRKKKHQINLFLISRLTVWKKMFSKEINTVISLARWKEIAIKIKIPKPIFTFKVAKYLCEKPKVNSILQRCGRRHCLEKSFFFHNYFPAIGNDGAFTDIVCSNALILRKMATHCFRYCSAGL